MSRAAKAPVLATPEPVTGIESATAPLRLDADWFSPWAHRATLVVALSGPVGAVSVSYLSDSSRRPAVPALWDRRTRSLISADAGTLDALLAVRLGGRSGGSLYPALLRQEIDELDAWLRPVLHQGIEVTERPGSEGRIARDRVRAALTVLERTFGHTRYLLGDRLTLADVRLFTTLVRYDAGPNRGGRIGPALSEYPELWAYARDLYQQPAFHGTTRFAAFSAGAAPAGWEAPVDRTPDDW